MRITIGLLCLTLVSCSYQWKRPVGFRPILPLVSNSAHLVGQGLQITRAGKTPHRCLEKLETTSTYGDFSATSELISDSFSSPNRALVHFVEQNRAILQNQQQAPNRPFAPITFLISLGVHNKKTSLVETKVKMAPWTWAVIDREGLEGFFDFCGTQVIRSATYESNAYIFLAYFPQSVKERARLKMLTHDHLTGKADNLLRLSLFDELPNRSTTYAALYTDTSLPIAPPEFAALSSSRKKMSSLINKLGQMLSQAGGGRLTSYDTVHWRQLNEGRFLFSSKAKRRGDPFQAESSADSIARLRDIVLSFEQLQAQINYWTQSNNQTYRDMADRCQQTIDKQTFRPSADQLDKCEKQAQYKPEQSFFNLEECNLFLFGEAQIFSASACRDLSALEPQLDSSFLQWEVYQPIELVTESGLSRWTDQEQVLTYLSNDSTTLDNHPPHVPLGTGMDVMGNTYEAQCILPPKKDEEQSSEKATPDEDVPPSANNSVSKLIDKISGKNSDDFDFPEWDESDWDPLIERARDRAINPKAKDSSTPPSKEPKLPKLDPELAPSADAGGPNEDNYENDRPPINVDMLREPGEAGTPLSDPLPDEKIDYWKDKTRSLTQAISLFGYRSWPWWKELLFFWKDPPKPRAIYRSVLQIHGSTALKSPVFQLTKEAQKLASTDLKQFLKKCGTHYVSQIHHRRGMVYYFTQGSPGDVEIKVIPFGVPQTVYEDDALKPNRVEEFFSNKDAVVAKLKSSDSAIPELLRLEPWLRYLLLRRIIEPEALRDLQ